MARQPDCFEGAGRTPALGNTTSALRKVGGCTDTNDNAADFLATTPTPRNTASTINDCNAPPDVTIDNLTITEGNAGSAVATFTVSLSKPAPGAGVTFYISTQDDTATTGDNDYEPKTLVAQNIAAGNTSYTFNVMVNGDVAVEPDETFFVNVSNVTGGILLDGQGVGTIQNDDSAPLPGLSINDISQSETNSGTTTFKFTVTSSLPAPAGGITFDIATSDGTAHDDTPPGEDNDYVARSLWRRPLPKATRATRLTLRSTATRWWKPTKRLWSTSRMFPMPRCLTVRAREQLRTTTQRILSSVRFTVAAATPVRPTTMTSSRYSIVAQP